MSQLRCILHVQLGKNSGLVIIDGLGTYGEVVGDVLRRIARRQEQRDFPLSIGKCAEALFCFCRQCAIVAVDSIQREGMANPIHERLGTKRLGNEIKRSVAHGLHGQLDVAVCRGKDDWRTASTSVEGLLQLQAAHSRHPNVEDKATRPPWIVFLQKTRRRTIASSHQALRLGQSANRATNILIVINNEDCALGLGRHRIQRECCHGASPT